MNHAIFNHSEEEAPNIRSFWFESEAPLSFIAGQYIELTLEHPEADERGTRRWFTISSAPDKSPKFSITTRLAGPNGSSFKTALAALEDGEKVQMTEPMGDFVLPRDTSRPLIFVAGGIGITPFHSILESLVAAGQTRDIKLIYAVNSESDIIFQPTFRAAGIEPIVVVNKPSPAWGGEQGHVSAAMILGLSQPSDDSLIYISGPEQMVGALQKDLQKSGVKKSQLVGDFFPGYPGI